MPTSASLLRSTPALWDHHKDLRRNVFLCQTGVAPRLPIIPQPQADEMFYSWVGRCHRRFGNLHLSDSLRAMFGTTKRSLYTSSLLKRDEPGVKHLVDACGSTLDRFYTEFTAWYYHAAFTAFSGGDHGVVVPGCKALLDIAGTTSKAKPFLSRCGRFVIRVGVGFRLCPTCVEEDYIAAGFPYWHRCHQLQGVETCHLHGTELVFACPDCGAAFLPDGRLMEPRRACIHCGAALKKNQSSSDQLVVEARMLFARISAGPIVYRTVPFSLPLLGMFYTSTANHLLPNDCSPTPAAKLSQLVLDRWGKTFLQAQLGAAANGRDLCSWINAAASGRIQPPLRHVILIGSITDDFRRFCDGYLDFVDALAKTSSIPPHRIPVQKPKPVRPKNPLSVSSARKELLKKLKRDPSLSRSELAYTMPRLSVALRTLDREWYLAHLPTKTRRRDGTFAEPGRVSSIESDRKALDDILRAKSAVTARTFNFSHKPLYRRMLLRDREWLAQELKPVKKPSQAVTAIGLRTKPLAAAEIAAAAKKIGQLPGRPKKVTTGRLMEALNTSRTTLINSKQREIKEALKAALESPEGYYHRLCLWAIRRLLQRDAAVTRTAIVKLTGTPKFPLSPSIQRAITESGLERRGRKDKGAI
jgi:hypothetical protein